jgi:hypothetical protein
MGENNILIMDFKMKVFVWLQKKKLSALGSYLVVDFGISPIKPLGIKYITRVSCFKKILCRILKYKIW